MNVLIVYYYPSWPLRSAIRDHLYSFARHSEHRCYYLNMAVRDVPRWMRTVPFDLIVFHTVFLSARWSLDIFARLRARARALLELEGIRIALPQDEFIHTDVLSETLLEQRVAHVFSVAPPSEWPAIYSGLAGSTVQFHEVLTGYLEDETVDAIEARRATIGEARTVDIGYRAWRAEPWLGRHGFLKTQIAERFEAQGRALGLSTDISTRSEDTILGDGWYDFLLRCKYTVGVEGGASILDRTGDIRERTTRYVAAHPEATFEEIEAACFPGEDGKLALFALSPRHLEACATRTCQVLVEGRYNGALKPDLHYLPLKADFSNIDSVLEHLLRDDLRAEITERAYRDIVASKLFSYRHFVSAVVAASGARPRAHGRAMSAWISITCAWARLADRFDWFRIRNHLLGMRGKASYAVRRAGVLVTTPAMRTRLKRMAG